MINRSTIKYNLKKILPSFIFSTVLFVWQKSLLTLVESLDTIRLKKFLDTKLVTLKQDSKNFKLYISPRNGFIDNYIFLYGVYESFILEIINKHLLPGMTFVDIGANIGQHSMFAASIVGKKGSVYSFEPIPHVYEQLLKSVHANNFDSIVHANNFALGAKNSSEMLYISSKNIGGSSLVNTEEGTEKIQVVIKNGDAVLSAIQSIDMVKIDVEGYEYEVLSGIQKTLADHKPIILLEFSGYFYEQQHTNNGAKILLLLLSIDYKLFDIEDDMKEIHNPESFLTLFVNNRRQTNLLCIVK